MYAPKDGSDDIVDALRCEWRYEWRYELRCVFEITLVISVLSGLVGDGRIEKVI